ncbi:MAG TPA: 3-hydroxyacyl-ACP dehydratase FabZ family protein [Nitrospinota bacterium]|nr:3-hydroxyacyl-ACP dehydratase FabZ family protein [Nitrospinota bacterium]
MRYLLIDHIVEWKTKENIKGIKNVAMSEDFLEFHFQKNPIMPGVLLLEALVQLAGWLEAASSDFKNWFLINKVIKSNFYGFAYPGDQIELAIELMADPNSSIKTYKGIGTVGGKKIIKSEFEGKIIPLSEIENIDEQKKFFQVLTRNFNLKT